MGSEGKEKKKRKHVDDEERKEEEDDEKSKKKKRKKSLGASDAEAPTAEEKGEDDEAEEEAGRSKWENVSVIAKPLAGKKLVKKCLKLVKRATKLKLLRRGVQETVKSVRKGQTGICFIAGNISPIDVISHLPILCEEHNIPYIYVPAKEDLGAASGTRRPASCLFVMPSNPKGGGDGGSDEKKFKSEYAELKEELEALETVWQ